MRPPAVRKLAQAQAELRHVVLEAQDAIDAGSDPTRAIRRQAELERSIRTQLLTAGGRRADLDRVPVADIRARLGERVLVSYVDMGGSLLALRVDDRRTRIVDLGPEAAVHRAVNGLRFALVALGKGVLAPSMIATMTEAARTLDRLLVEPVKVDGRPLVVVPTRRMFTLPWRALPSLRTSPISVVPSATQWFHAERRRRASGRVVVAAGPEVPFAEKETVGVAGLWPDPIRLVGGDATVEALLAAASGADVLHVACHGVLRADNPLFSHLRMADGPLAVHDIEGLKRAPATVVLSACDSALAQPRPGGEWLGMASAFMSLGTRSLVASVLPVPDTQATVALMTDLHARLAGGEEPTRALAGAAGRVDSDEPLAFATASTFVCFGR